jgi:hypothetical protein
MDVCLLWVLCVCQVEVSATGWSLVQRSPTDCVWSPNLTNEKAKTRKWVVKARSLLSYQPLGTPGVHETVERAFAWKQNGWVVKPPTFLHLRLRLRMRGAIPPLRLRRQCVVLN